jgi:hypothetical protein
MPKPYPAIDAEACQQAQAERDAEHRQPRNPGHAKRPQRAGLGVPQIDDDDAHQDESEQCTRATNRLSASIGVVAATIATPAPMDAREHRRRRAARRRRRTGRIRPFSP